MTSTLAEHQSRVKAELARVLHSQALASLAGGFVVAITLVVILFNSADQLQLFLWGLLYIAVSAVRFSLWRYYRDEINLDSKVQSFQQYMGYALMTSGVIWAAGAWLGVISTDSTISSLTLIVFCALIAGAIGSLAASVTYYVLYALPIILVIVYQLWISDFYHPIIAVAYFFYFVVCLQYTRTMQQTLITSIQLQIENEQLITDLTASRDELSEMATIADTANQAKSKLLAAASHDLAQPLHALELFMSALKREKDQTKKDHLIKNASRSVTQLSGMFTSLLDLSRLDSGVIDTAIEPINSRELLEPVVQEIQSRAESKGLKFEASIANHSIETDSTLLQRIVRNLLTNALDYTEEGTIRMSLFEQEGLVHICIEDTGPGITDSELSKIYEEHYQGSRSSGLGLGLSLVKRFCDLLDMDIRVQSTVGQGTRFVLTLQGTTSETTNRVQTEQVSNLSLAGIKIIFVEDESSTREAMGTLFDQWQADYVIGESWESIQTQIGTSAFRPDIVISDFHLGEITTALDIQNHVRETFQSSPAFLVITGDASSGLETLQTQQIPHLRKPVSADELAKSVTNLLAS